MAAAKENCTLGFIPDRRFPVRRQDKFPTVERGSDYKR